MKYVLILMFIFITCFTGCDLGTQADSSQNESPKVQQLYYLEHGRITNGAKQIISTCQKARCMYEATKTYPSTTFPFQTTVTEDGVNNYIKNLDIDPDKENIWLVIRQTGGIFFQYQTVSGYTDYVFVIKTELL